MRPVATKREIEIKLAVRDLAAVVRRLRSSGAKVGGRVFEQNTLYDTSERDLWRRGYLLRLRSENPARSAFARAGVPGSALTFKAPIQEKAGRERVANSRYKERLEREAVIRNPGQWDEIFRSLGFVPGFRYEKYRTTFRLADLHIALDETPVGDFLELEGAPQAIDGIADRLGYTRLDYERRTYWDLYVRKCRREACAATNMVFDK